MNEKWEFRKKEKKREIELGPATAKGSRMAGRESGTSPPRENIRCCMGFWTWEKQSVCWLPKQ